MALEAFEYGYATAFLCDDHYIYGESTLTVEQVRTLTRSCNRCYVVDRNDN